MYTLEPGTQSTASLTITADDTAAHLRIPGPDTFPEVFATSRMVALMEVAAARMLVPLLQPGQLSVGVEVNIKHLAATPVGAEVKAEATFLGMAGKLYRFKVEAFDPGGKIGEGEHTRAIISTERLMEGAKNRAMNA